jgi:hypothetical protein
MLAIGLAAGYELGGGAASQTASAGKDGPGVYRPAEAPSDKLVDSFEATLQGALDSGAAGQGFAYRAAGLGEGRIELGHSFTTGFGTDCREFRREEMRGDARSASNGLACRATDGTWNALLFPGS